MSVRISHLHLTSTFGLANCTLYELDKPLPLDVPFRLLPRSLRTPTSPPKIMPLTAPSAVSVNSLHAPPFTEYSNKFTFIFAFAPLLSVKVCSLSAKNVMYGATSSTLSFPEVPRLVTTPCFTVNDLAVDLS